MKKKTIFTIMTLGLVTLLGFGFLGGIHYQPKEAKASEITTQPTKKYKKITFSSDYVGKDLLLYFVAKNYENNGNGTFYNGDHIGLDTSSSFPGGNIQNQYDYHCNITLLNGNTTIQSVFQFSGALYDTQPVLKYVFFVGSGTYNYLYNCTGATSGYFTRGLSAFLVKKISNTNDTSRFITCINTYFDVYDLNNEYFNFDAFNPYYLWNVNYKENPYVNYTSDIGYVHRIKIEPFFVSGYAFDTIRINYANADQTHFKIGDNYITTNFSSTGNYVYFNDMGYENSATQYYLPILKQEVIYGTNNYEGMTINVGSLVWVSDEYKSLQFFSTPSTITTNKLYALTNVSQRAEFVSYNDVGLGNAFALISQAFTAWLPILQVTIVPGITLGLLLFLPLIAGIVIFIIWIVKR